MYYVILHIGKGGPDPLDPPLPPPPPPPKSAPACCTIAIVALTKVVTSGCSGQYPTANGVTGRSLQALSGHAKAGQYLTAEGRENRVRRFTAGGPMPLPETEQSLDFICTLATAILILMFAQAAKLQ